MRLAVLGSGSGGNSLIIESGGRRLLVDAGFSCRQIEQRLASRGEDLSRPLAIAPAKEIRRQAEAPAPPPSKERWRSTSINFPVGTWLIDMPN